MGLNFPPGNFQTTCQAFMAEQSATLQIKIHRYHQKDGFFFLIECEISEKVSVSLCSL